MAIFYPNSVFKRSRRHIIFISLALLLLSVISLYHKDAVSAALASTLPKSFSSSSPSSTPSTRKRKNVLVASRFPHHHDVYLGLVWKLEQALKKDGGSIEVYCPTPLNYNFSAVVDELGLYSGPFKDPMGVTDAVKANPDIDMVVLGTCEIDLREEQLGKELLEAWDARDDAHKFKLVCFVHNSVDETWQAAIPEWSRRNAIRLVAISEHVVKAFRKKFLRYAGSNDVVRNTAGYEYIPVDAFVPILDIPNLTNLSPSRILSNAVIPGSYSLWRRDYPKIFKELIRCLIEDPRSWGYLPLGSGPSFMLDTSLNYPPFHLHLVGTGGLEVPPELANVVIFHSDLTYDEFYSVMQGMDLCVPGLVVEDAYYEYQGSSTSIMCMEVDLPILATRRLRDAYTFLDDDSVLVTRPAAMGAVRAIHALRTGDVSRFLASDPSQSGITLGSHPYLREAVEKMLRQGWVRPKRNFDIFKRKIWKDDEEVVQRLLWDRP